MSVVPLSELGLCITDAGVVQAACDAAILARQASFTTWAQDGATAAITAANLPDSADVQAACDAAILARQASFTTWAQDGATAAITAASLASSADLSATEASLDAAISAVADNVVIRSVGTAPLHISVTIAAGPAFGTVIAAPGAGLRYIVMAMLVSSTLSSTFSLSSAGGSTMGTHSIVANGNLSLSLAFQPIMTGGLNASLIANKTAAASIVVDVWYYIG